MQTTKHLDPEHAAIMRLFVQSNYSSRVWFGVGDDAAVLYPSHDAMVMTTDALVQGTHFLPDSEAADIAYKAVLTSLSDIVAMGAVGQSVLVSLSLPDFDLSWLECFSSGLKQVLQDYQLDLIGGNLARGPLSVHTFLQGALQSGQVPLLQHTIEPGDAIYLTGPLGGAAFALQQYHLGQADSACHAAFWRPHIAVNCGLALHGVAHACVDISDGLWRDLNRISCQSKQGIVLQAQDIPRHSLLQDLDDKTALAMALSGGEDYPLCFAVPKDKLSQLNFLAARLSQSLYCIGHVDESVTGVVVVDDRDQIIEPYWASWEHFNET